MRKIPSILLAAVCLTAGGTSHANLVTLGDPSSYDFSYESDKVCCVDVAVVDMFNYLKSDDYPIVDPSTSIKDQQESFHKLYDPKFEGKIPGAFTVKDALATHLANRQLKADITVFTTPELDYGKLIQEWQKGEMIILFSFIQNQGNAGHAMFLWGLDDNPKTPRLDIIDPLVHPNTNNN